MKFKDNSECIERIIEVFGGCRIDYRDPDNPVLKLDFDDGTTKVYNEGDEIDGTS